MNDQRGGPKQFLGALQAGFKRVQEAARATAELIKDETLRK